MSNQKINLLDYRNNKYTSTGNDGIIQRILEVAGIQRGYFVEFGAWDGIKNSNCRRLFDEGWSGLFIEADKDKHKELRKNYDSFNHVSCCFSKISTKKEKFLFDQVALPYVKDGHIDFCSIDVDGRDVEVFETFKKYLPTIICIEGGQMLHPFHKRIKNSIAKHNIQQSLRIMKGVFEKKGYRLLCSYQDSFFILDELYDLFNVEDNIIKIYFNGLRAIPRRLPFVQKYLSKCDLNNIIIDNILEESGYKKYKWAKRKLWAKEEIDKIMESIDRQERRELKNG